MRKYIWIFALISQATLAGAVAHAGPFDWKVTKPGWTDADEKKFSAFVARIGDSGCRTLNDCLTASGSNPEYAARTPRDLPYLADCADLPFMLRAYFAWMEGLPFDYVSEVVPADPNEEALDTRYTLNGNKPTNWRRLVPGKTYNAAKEFEAMRDNVSTATYRIHYRYVSDFYPVKLSRDAIRPGTVVYDPAGHAAMVYRVEKNGRVKMFDAHPDQSITRITYDKKFVRSRAAHGAGFKNWRGAGDTRASSALPGFSTEEFNASFKLGGERVSYYDYLRYMLAGANLQYDPVNEMRSMVTELCGNLQDRANAVEVAIQSGIQNKNHPVNLPNNIYGTSGEWETYSSPSRDARLKVAYQELRDETIRFLAMYKAGNIRIAYTPQDSRYSAGCGSDRNCFLAASLLTAFEDEAARCHVTYTNTAGARITLSYPEIQQRLFKLSFDPYHCVELRWGASSPEELQTCPASRAKSAWYRAEQNLRNQLERTYSQPMGTDVSGTSRLGVTKTPDVDLAGALRAELRI